MEISRLGILFVLSFGVARSTAQNVSFRKDTIIIDDQKYGILKSYREQKRYLILSLAGMEQMELHNARIEIYGMPCYVLTFLNDRKQALVQSSLDFPITLIKEMASLNLLVANAIDTTVENHFSAAHFMPDGYTDIDQLIEY